MFCFILPLGHNIFGTALMVGLCILLKVTWLNKKFPLILLFPVLLNNNTKRMHFWATHCPSQQYKYILWINCNNDDIPIATVGTWTWQCYIKHILPILYTTVVTHKPEAGTLCGFLITGSLSYTTKMNALPWYYFSVSHVFFSSASI